MTKFDRPGVRGRASGAKKIYNYLDERVKLAELLKRPVWVEYPEGEDPGTLARYPLIHSSLGNGVELWIADDNEGVGLLGLDEYERMRARPDTRWVVVIEQNEIEIARQESGSPDESGLIEALRAALKQASDD